MLSINFDFLKQFLLLEKEIGVKYYLGLGLFLLYDYFFLNLMTNNLSLFTYEEAKSFRIDIERMSVTISHTQRWRDGQQERGNKVFLPIGERRNKV